jgi:hypothetical protein
MPLEPEGQTSVQTRHKAQYPGRLGWVCAVQRRRFSVGESPTRQPLQPVAIGAVMEVTKWLKPLNEAPPDERGGNR